MNRLLESILNTDVSSTIYKIGQPFSLTEQLAKISPKHWKDGYPTYIDGSVDPRNTSLLWKNINAVIENIGNTVYEKINNYIDNISDVDTCGIKQLKSLCSYVGYLTTQTNNVSLDYEYPSEITELLDIFSINPAILLNTDSVINPEYKQKLLNSLSSIYSSLSSDDPRAEYQENYNNSLSAYDSDSLEDSPDTPEPLRYFSIVNNASLKGDYYRSYSDNTSLFSNKKLNLSSYIDTLSLLPNKKLLLIKNKDNEIIGSSDDVEIYDSWLSGEDILSTRIDINESVKVTAKESIIFPEVKDNFVVVNDENIYAITENSKYGLVTDNQNTISLTTPNSFSNLLYAQQKTDLNDCEFLPNTADNYISLFKDTDSYLKKFNDENKKVSINELFPFYLTAPSLLTVINGTTATNGNYSYDFSNDKLIWKKAVDDTAGNYIIADVIYNSCDDDKNVDINTIVKATYPLNGINTLILKNDKRKIKLSDKIITLFDNITDSQNTGIKVTAEKKTSSYKYTITYYKDLKTSYSITTEKEGIDFSTIPELYFGEINDEHTYNWQYSQSTPENIREIFNSISIIRKPYCLLWHFYQNNRNMSGDGVATVIDENLTVEAPTIPISNGNKKLSIIQSFSSTYFSKNNIAKAIFSKWAAGEYILKYDSSLTTKDYKNYIKSIFYKVLHNICYLKYADKENVSGSTYIFQDAYNDLNDKSIFLDNLEYSNSTEKENSVSAKLVLGVPLTFNEHTEFENIIYHKTNYDDYSDNEKKILDMYYGNQISSARLQGNNLSRFSKMRENKVKEYFKFILNFSEYSLSSNFNNMENYSVDNNYFKITQDNTNSLYSYTESGDISLNDDLILNIASHLADVSLSIAQIRDTLKTEVNKVYMTGTWNILRNYVIEYLLNSIYQAYPEISSYSTNSLKIDLIEYSDNSEYYNIRKYDLSAYTKKYKETLNEKYWSSIDNRYESLDSLSDSDISSFYYKSLGLSLVDENGNANNTDKSLKDFLTTIFNAGASDDLLNSYGTLSSENDRTTLAKYSGTTDGTSPWYNYKNLVHPSYQLHQYIYGFSKYVYNQFALENLFATATALYEDEIIDNLKGYLDNEGNVIDKWIAGRNDFTGYNSSYETYNWSSDKYIRNDGPFNMYALKEYLDNKNLFIEQLSNDTNYYYKHLALPKNAREQLVTILKNDIIFNAIKNIDKNKIYKYAEDKFENSITLYKEDMDKNTEGTLWFKPVGYPLSIPMFIVTKNTSGNTVLSTNNLIQQHSSNAVDTLDELISDTTIDKDIGYIKRVYDFDLNTSTNNFVLCIKKATPNTISENKLLDISDNCYNTYDNITKIEYLLANNKNWNYANSMPIFFKLDRLFDANSYSYKFYTKMDNPVDKTGRSSQTYTNNSKITNQLITTYTTDKEIYCVYVKNSFGDGILAENQTNPYLDKLLTITVEKYPYDDIGISKVYSIPVAYNISTKNINELIGNPFNCLASILDDCINVAFEINVQDKTDNNSLVLTHLTNYPGYTSQKDTQPPDDSTIKLSYFFEEANSYTLNMDILDKMYMSINLNCDLISTPVVDYFYSQSDNQFISLYPATLGYTKLWNTPGLSALSSYNLQLVCSNLENEEAGLIYEDAMLNNIDKFDTSAYNLSSFKAIYNLPTSSYMTTVSVATGSSTDTLKYTVPIEINKDVAIETYNSLTSLNNEKYNDLASKYKNLIDNFDIVSSQIINNLSNYAEISSDVDISTRAANYQWKASEDDSIFKTDSDTIKSFIPYSKELIELGSFSTPEGKSDIFNNYSLVELDKNYTMYLQYTNYRLTIKDLNNSSINHDISFILKKTENSSDEEIGVEKTITVSNLISNSMKTYKIKLLDFKPSNNKIKLLFTK